MNTISSDVRCLTPTVSERPYRSFPIDDDDIVDLIIALETEPTFEGFIERV